MKTIQIKTSKKHRKNMLINTTQGVVEFDNSLIADVNPQVVNELFKNDPSLSLVDQNDLKIVSSIKGDTLCLEEEIVDLKKINSKLQDEINNKDSEIIEFKKLNNLASDTISELKKQIEDFKTLSEKKPEVKKEDVIKGKGVEEELTTEETLNAMTVTALKKMLEEAEVPDTEWKSLKKDELVAFILKQ